MSSTPTGIITTFPMILQANGASQVNFSKSLEYPDSCLMLSKHSVEEIAFYTVKMSKLADFALYG